MTLPRQVLPGTTYLLTRRCSERRYFLRPSKATDQTFRFILAILARRYGVIVHAYCVLSTHYHLVLTDPNACLPAFGRELHGLVARAFNAIHGRSEAMWSPGSYSAVALKTPETIIAKIAYVLANPVAAGLVSHGYDWPGLWSAPALIGGAAMLVERPDFFFRERGPFPAVATLQLHRPAGFASADTFDRELADALHALEAEATAKLAAENRRFLGAAWVLAQDPFGRPTSPAPIGRLKPRIACRDKWKRIEALSRLATFADSYRKALAEWRKGVRDTLFPEGTYLMRVVHGANCAALA